MELYDVMRTTFAARQFTEDEVSDETLHRILDNARFAPSGGNRQGWRVIIIRDQEKRVQLVPLLEPVIRRYRAQVAAGENPFNTIVPTKITEADVSQTELPVGYSDPYLKSPVLLLILVDLSVVASMDYALERVGVVSGASVYPFAWNILLAARNEGLGGTLTTFAAVQEPMMMELFDVPDNFAVCAVLPIGKPVKQPTKLRRNPVSHFASFDTFHGDPFG
ncbi:MAG: nitroreductase family protein [Gammaproteobacteria bacterium]|nr:nitroreductase family protein [Gammaproteobacteria bacterium]MYF37231.1 nitroreductase family protein [Gammaproteobacteria bacterium]